MDKEQLIRLLRQDVVPALGCTEPGCAALCAANAAKLLKGDAVSLDIEVNPGIYKNGMSAGIPNCPHVGLAFAGALGALLKNPERELTLFEDITPETLLKAEALVSAGAVRIRIAENETSLYVKCSAVSELKENAVCVIRNAHTEVVRLERNGVPVFEKAPSGTSGSAPDPAAGLLDMTLSGIRDLVDTIPEEDLLFLLDGVEMNEALAAYSETTPAGVGIADAFREEMAPDAFRAETAPGAILSGGLAERIILKVSSAAESRLDGCPLPTMSSSGAGTKGLVVILPVSETADVLGVPRVQKVRALALAHLVNRYINGCIGRLSPMCTCVAAASTAAAVGMTYLLGGTNEQLGFAVRNMTGTVAGMLCDGGKVGCALKVASGSVSALLCAVTAVRNAPLRASDGICAETPEQCIRNIASVGSRGMKDTDREIIRIMNEKAAR